MGKLSLEQEFQRELNLPCRLRRLDLIESGRTDVAVGQPEIGVIEDVKEFRAELKFFRFSHANVFDCRKIPVRVTGAFCDVAAC